MSLPHPANPSRAGITAPARGQSKPPNGGRPGSSGTGHTLDGVRVLVVEDDPPSLRLLRAVLQGEGCDVRFATSAEEAFVVLQTFRPALMIIDLILPLMSGLLLAQQLKAQPATNAVPLVAVTAFNGHGAERVALDAGFAAYVRKPIDPASFCELLGRTLEGTPC